MRKTRLNVLSLFSCILCLIVLVSCSTDDKTGDTLTTDEGTSDVEITYEEIDSGGITICPPDDYAPGVFAGTFEKVKALIEEEDLSKYDEKLFSEQRKIYQAMYDSFNVIGYFYSIKTSGEDDAITLVDDGDYSILVFPNDYFKSAGIWTWIWYKGHVYHVMIYQVDKTYVEDDQPLSDYIYKKAGRETYGEALIGDNVVYYADYNNICGGLSYIDENYYYYIRPDLKTVPVDELNELLSLIEFERVEIGSIDYADYNIEEYTVGILGHLDSFPASVDYGIITELYSENAFEHISPASERVVIIGQNEIRGGYVKTYNRFPSYYPLYKYSSYDGKYGFSVDEKGRVSSYINYGIIENTDETLSDNEYITIAKNFVKGVYGRVPDWELFEVSIEKDKEIKGYYSISFEKYLYGMKTSENIYVQVAYSGEISMFSADMFGRIPANIDISVFEPQTVKAAVYKRLDDIYGGMSKETRDKYKTRYYLPDPILSVLADGTPCYIYDVNVKFISVDNQESHTDIVRVVVTPTE